jgi:hypothetical protein
MEFQPWFRAYADMPERKAHYSDAQFRAFIELLCATAVSRTPGTFPSLASVRRVVGDTAHFLIEQEDLCVEPDGSISVVGWVKYQRPFDRTHADRQARYRERKAVEDAERDSARDASRDGHNVSSLHRHDVSSTSLSYVENDQEKTDTFSTQGSNGHGPVPDSDHDSLDAYYELTGYRPWGQWSGDKLRVAIRDFGDAATETALRAEHKANPERQKLLDRTLARLARDAEKARLAREPAKVTRASAKIDKARYDAIRAELASETLNAGEPG